MSITDPEEKRTPADLIPLVAPETDSAVVDFARTVSSIDPGILYDSSIVPRRIVGWIKDRLWPRSMDARNFIQRAEEAYKEVLTSADPAEFASTVGSWADNAEVASFARNVAETVRGHAVLLLSSAQGLLAALGRIKAAQAHQPQQEPQDKKAAEAQKRHQEGIDNLKRTLRAAIASNRPVAWNDVASDIEAAGLGARVRPTVTLTFNDDIDTFIQANAQKAGVSTDNAWRLFNYNYTPQVVQQARDAVNNLRGTYPQVAVSLPVQSVVTAQKAKMRDGRTAWDNFVENLNAGNNAQTIDRLFELALTLGPMMRDAAGRTAILGRAWAITRSIRDLEARPEAIEQLPAAQQEQVRENLLEQLRQAFGLAETIATLDEAIPEAVRILVKERAQLLALDQQYSESGQTAIQRHINSMNRQARQDVVTQIINEAAAELSQGLSISAFNQNLPARIRATLTAQVEATPQAEQGEIIGLDEMTPIEAGFTPEDRIWLEQLLRRRVAESQQGQTMEPQQDQTIVLLEIGRGSHTKTAEVIVGGVVEGKQAEFDLKIFDHPESMEAAAAAYETAAEGAPLGFAPAYEVHRQPERGRPAVVLMRHSEEMLGDVLLHTPHRDADYVHNIGIIIYSYITMLEYLLSNGWFVDKRETSSDNLMQDASFNREDNSIQQIDIANLTQDPAVIAESLRLIVRNEKLRKEFQQYVEAIYPGEQHEELRQRIMTATAQPLAKAATRLEPWLVRLEQTTPPQLPEIKAGDGRIYWIVLPASGGVAVRPVRIAAIREKGIIVEIYDRESKEWVTFAGRYLTEAEVHTTRKSAVNEAQSHNLKWVEAEPGIIINAEKLAGPAEPIQDGEKQTLQAEKGNLDEEMRRGTRDLETAITRILQNIRELERPQRPDLRDHRRNAGVL